jgi:rubrerythrin
MAAAASPINREKRKEDNTKKLTKVLSTKISMEDYNRFEKYTNYAYQAGIIKGPETSKFLRYIVTYPFNELGL